MYRFVSFSALDLVAVAAYMSMYDIGRDDNKLNSNSEKFTFPRHNIGLKKLENTVF